MSALTPIASESKSNPNAISVRIKSRDAKGAANQRSHDLRIGRQPQYVDEAKSHLNRHLIRALSASDIRKVCEARREAAGLERKRAVASNAAVATIGIITFGIQAQKVMAEMDAQTQDKLFRDVAERVAERLGTSITGLSVHADETALHAHFQMPAVSIYGTPVSKIAVKRVLNEIQTIASEVAGKYDKRIERGRPRLVREAAGEKRSETINRLVRTLHDDLPLEVASLWVQVQQERERLAKNKRLADAANEKATKNEARAEKALKNAATYERRVADAQKKILDMESELLRLTELDEKILAAEKRLEPLQAAIEALDQHEASVEAKIAEEDQRQLEDAAAALMFGQNIDVSAIAILAAGDLVEWDGYGRQIGGWKLGETLKEYKIEVPSTGLTDFQKVSQALTANQDSVEDLKDRLAEDPDAKIEFESVRESLGEIGGALSRTGQWSRSFFRKARALTRELIEISFDRLVSVIKSNRDEALRNQPSPEEAKDFKDLPETAQAAVRKAISSKGPDPT